MILLNTLPWRSDVRDIPFDVPVLVLPTGDHLPYMARRNKEYMPDQVECYLRSEGYDWYESVDELVGWMELFE